MIIGLLCTPLLASCTALPDPLQYRPRLGTFFLQFASYIITVYLDVSQHVTAGDCFVRKGLLGGVCIN